MCHEKLQGHVREIQCSQVHCSHVWRKVDLSKKLLWRAGKIWEEECVHNKDNNLKIQQSQSSATHAFLAQGTQEVTFMEECGPCYYDKSLVAY